MLQCLIRPLRTFVGPCCMLVKWTAHISGRLINAKRHSHAFGTISECECDRVIGGVIGWPQ